MLLNCLNKRNRFAEGFNTKEVLLILLASLFLTVLGLEFTIIMNKKILIANFPNGKISLQHEMQNIYNQCDSDFYVSFESKTYKYHIGLYCQYL